MLVGLFGSFRLNILWSRSIFVEDSKDPPLIWSVSSGIGEPSLISTGFNSPDCSSSASIASNSLRTRLGGQPALDLLPP